MNSFQHWLHQTLPRIWQRRGWAARCLWPLSVLYRVAWQLKSATTRPAPALPVPVLVVGNVMAGGAGKTPTVLAVIAHFQQRGVAVGVVSRGYGRLPTAPDCVLIGQPAPAPAPFAGTAPGSTAPVWSTDPRLCGDEPLLIHQRGGVPVAVCAQRTRAALALLAQYPHIQLVLCDDGMQHLALPRQGEICVMDERGTGNGWLLPAGPLREPWPRTTTVLLHTAAPQHPVAYASGQAVFHAQRQLASHAISSHGQRHLLQDWASNAQPVIALAGIAQPHRFFHMLRQLGLVLRSTHALPDHAPEHALHALLGTLMAQELPILCTEKDAVKIWPLLQQVRPGKAHAAHAVAAVAATATAAAAATAEDGAGAAAATSGGVADAWAVPLQLTPHPAFFAALDTWWAQHRPAFPPQP